MVIQMEFHRKHYPVNTLLYIIEQLKENYEKFYVTAKVKPENKPINNIMKKFDFKLFNQNANYNYWELLVERE